MLEKTTPTAIIYARVSSQEQNDGISVDSQIEQGMKMAEGLGAKLLHVFRDDGVSGRTDKRPAFQSAIAYCDARSVDYFICWSTSRFARNKLDAASYKKLLGQSQTKVVYVSINIDSDTDEGWFTESIFEIMDEHQSRQNSKDTRRSMLKNARDGFWNGGPTPYGYESVADGDRKRLRIKELEAAVVRSIYDTYLAGDGCKIIANKLNKQALSHKGKAWSKAQVMRVLKNQVYTGVVLFNRKSAGGIDNPESEWIVTPSHEKIISVEEFNRVRETFLKRTVAAPVQNNPCSNRAFSGMLRCGLCGAGMRTETATGRNKTYNYYNCSTFVKTGGCKSRRIAADEFDEWMIDVVLSRILTRERMIDMLGELKSITGQAQKSFDLKYQALLLAKQKNTKDKSKIMGVIAEFGMEAPGVKSLLDKLSVLEKEQASIAAAIIDLDNSPAPHFDITEEHVQIALSTLTDIIKNTENNKKTRELMGTFIEAIDVNAESIDIRYRPERIIGTQKKNHEHVVHSSDFWGG